MSYRLKPHLDALFGPAEPQRADSADSGAPALEGRWFALLDLGPFVPIARPLERLLARRPGALLFEPSAGADALAYSPRLIELGDTRARARELAESLDAVCGHLPALSLLTGDLTAPALLERLRFLMWVDADHTPFLLRVGDTPSMRAVAAVLTVRQRAEVFAGLRGWWCVDPMGRLHNLVGADPSAEAGADTETRPGEPMAL